MGTKEDHNTHTHTHTHTHENLMTGLMLSETDVYKILFIAQFDCPSFGEIRKTLTPKVAK
jgi:hypothetical protein